VFSARTPAETLAQPAYLAFKTVKPSSETQFLTALVPAKNESAAQSVINQMTEIVGENLKGVLVERGKETDLVMFRGGAEAQTIRQGEWSADAESIVTTQTENNLTMFAVHDARSLRRGNRIMFLSESPTSIAVNFNINEIDAVCSAERAAQITLYVGKNPARVLLDDKELGATALSFHRADGTITLSIPAGQHVLKILSR
jgi:hypothetical protein